MGRTPHALPISLSSRGPLQTTNRKAYGQPRRRINASYSYKTNYGQRVTLPNVEGRPTRYVSFAKSMPRRHSIWWHDAPILNLFGRGCKTGWALHCMCHQQIVTANSNHGGTACWWHMHRAHEIGRKNSYIRHGTSRNKDVTECSTTKGWWKCSCKLSAARRSTNGRLLGDARSWTKQTAWRLSTPVQFSFTFL
jgi:hypothetical protein